MTPTLLDRELVWLDVRPGPLQRGQIVACAWPGHGTVVKRVAGLAGDRVEVREGLLVLNGEPVPAVAQGTRENWRDAAQVLPLRALHAEVRQEQLGPAHLIQRYVPSGSTPPYLVPEGMVFLLGDNRDDSLDSRTWGAVPRASVLGTVASRPAAPAGRSRPGG